MRPERIAASITALSIGILKNRHRRNTFSPKIAHTAAAPSKAFKVLQLRRIAIVITH
jgi:hypothetical protein